MALCPFGRDGNAPRKLARQAFGRARIFSYRRPGIYAWLRPTESPFRIFLHSTQNIERMLGERGRKRIHERQSLVWKVAVFVRSTDPTRTGAS